jgi:hypothetical protein
MSDYDKGGPCLVLRAKAIGDLDLDCTRASACIGGWGIGDSCIGGQMKIEASLADKLRANDDGTRKFAVIVSFKDSESVQVLRHMRVEPTTVYQSIAAAAAVVTAAQIEALAASPDVTSIELDQPAEALRKR